MSVDAATSAASSRQYFRNAIIVSLFIFFLAAAGGWGVQWGILRWFPWRSKLVTQGTISREIIISDQSYTVREPTPWGDSVEGAVQAVFPVSVFLEFQPLAKRARFLVEAEKATDLEVIFSNTSARSDLEKVLLRSLYSELPALVPSEYSVNVLPHPYRWCSWCFYPKVDSLALFAKSFALLFFCFLL